jgi:ADP-heptose:LPS heptosyltransferase
VLQPGATDPRRRWPTHKFAAVGDAFAARGACVAINGTAAERPLVADTLARMRRPALDLTGLPLGALAALLARARLLVSNDSGPLHLADALGCASVGIYWFSNLLVAAPLFQARHRAALATRLDCPVCGAPNLDTRCAHDVSFVDAVSVDEVLELAAPLYASSEAASSARA